MLRLISFGSDPLCPPAVRSVSRCDRGSDPAVPELATEGLTHCRAPLHETPAPHSSDSKPPFPSLRCLLSVAALPPFRRFASSFPSLQGVRPAVASRASLGGTSGQTPFRPPAVRSGCRCNRGSDPMSRSAARITFPAQKRTKPPFHLPCSEANEATCSTTEPPQTVRV